MKRLAIVTTVLALIFIVAQQLAQAQQCTAQDCIYLPAAQQGIGQAAPTETPPPPIVGSTPDPAGNGCQQNAPAPAEGAQAWFSYVYFNGPAYPTSVLCVRLVVSGRFVTGFTAQVVVHGATRDGMHITSDSASGVVAVHLQDTTADYVNGQATRVDIAIPYLDRVYVAQLTFVPLQGAPTVTPTSTLIPPTNTPTTTNTPIPPTATNIPPTDTPTP